MKKENFLNYKNYLWLKITSFFCVLMSVIYFIDSPVGEASGGSVIGYTYGGIATAGILYLMYYGRRKRSYFSSNTTLLGVLSAHSWIGLSLLIIVPLHAAFSFGLNVHTFAYFLLCMVVFSGIWGAYLYLKLPQGFSSQRGGLKIKDLIAQLQTLDKEVENKFASLDETSKAQFLKFKTASKIPSFLNCCFSLKAKSNDQQDYSSVLSDTEDDKQDQALNFISLLAKKNEILQKLKGEVRTQVLLKVWLYFHVPLSIAMSLVVLIHIFAVFYYC